MKTHELPGAQVPEASGTNPRVEQALYYHDLGFTVIDLPWGRKSPEREGWQFERLSREDLQQRFSPGPRNIAMFTGEISSNTVDADQDHLAWARVAPTYLPPTGMRFDRPSKPGAHRLYECSNPLKSRKFVDPIPVREGGMGTIGELRASASLITVLPNSEHPSGEQIRWTELGERAKVDGPELWAAYAKGCALILLAHHWPDAGRHDATLALSGGLLRAGWDENEVVALAESLCHDTAKKGEIEHIVSSTATKLQEGEAVTGWPSLADHVNPAVVRQVRVWLGIEDAASRPALTDFGNAERFVKQHGQNVLYCALWGKWLVWDGNRWRIDDPGRVREWAKQTIRSIPDETKDEPDGDRRKKILGWAISSEQGKHLETMLSRVTSVEGIAIEPDDLDSEPWLLNVANGTLDLHKMELREPRREDRITKVMPVAYLPGAKCSTWTAFLDTAMRGNEALIGYLRRLIGYSLTGDITEKMLPVLWGNGDTGKTTLVETLQAMFGPDYGMTTPESTIAVKRGGSDAIPNDVARLRAARFVTVSETSEGLQLNEGRIKAMTGRNPLPCRFMHGEWFQFVPEFKLFIETNHRPQIKGTDSAIWNRVKLIPFTNVVPKEQQDKRLPDKLRAELPGILVWALGGCAEWKQGGLREPAEIRDATAEYREHSDQLGEFLAESCIVGGEDKIRSSTLYKAYAAYVEERGQHPLGDQRFSDAMRERGFVKYLSKKIGHWRGITLNPHDQWTAGTLVPENVPEASL